MQKKRLLGQKNSIKCFFLWVFMYALQDFGIFLCHTKDTQTHKTTALMEAQGVETKRGNFIQKNMRFRPKNVKGRGFFAVFRSALEHFGI